MREVMSSFANGEAFQPLRMVVDAPMVPGLTLLKPAKLAGSDGAYGLKVVSVFPGNPARGLPATPGLVALLDPGTGVPVAMLCGATVTELRTAAVSALATQLLAREDADDLALLGTGAQARGHLLAIAGSRKLSRIRVWGRNAARATELVAFGAGHGLTVETMPTVRAVVDGASIVCTLTSATEPILEAEWLADGVHVNAVGAFRPGDRELASGVVVAARVFVDSSVSALAEAGDLLIPIDEGAIDRDVVPIEIGDVIVGKVAGRTTPTERTVFKSLGLAVQDVAAASAAFSQARMLGLGVDVDFP